MSSVHSSRTARHAQSDARTTQALIFGGALGAHYITQDELHQRHFDESVLTKQLHEMRGAEPPSVSQSPVVVLAFYAVIETILGVFSRQTHTARKTS